MTDKESLYKELCLKTNNNLLREIDFKKAYPEIYKELSRIRFPDNFKFSQKLYHYLKNDLKLKIGTCIECGNRCGFLGFGHEPVYRKYCSVKCMSCAEPVKAKRIHTNLLKYNTDNPSKSEIVKEKTRKNNIKKYGVEFPQKLERIKDKTRKTVKTNFRVDWPMQSKAIQKKARQTCKKHYNVENPAQANSVKEKIKHTNNKKYGGNAPACSDKIKEKTKQTNLIRYGYENTWLLSKHPRQSKGETELYNYNKRKGLYAYEIWNNDKKKIDATKSSGIELVIVWETEWTKNQEKAKTKISQIINKKIKF